MSGIRSKKKLLLIIPAAVIVGLLVWNVMLQMELKKYKPQVEAYLPEDVYVAVGSTVELYDDEVVWSGLRDGYACNWDCEIGENLEDRFSVTGKEEQVGEYDLTLTVFDYNVNEVITLKSTLHVVEKLEGEYSLVNIGDSLSDGREWYRTIYHLSGDQITFAGTRGWTRYSHEGRSGFSAQDYLEPTKFYSDGNDEGVQPFYDPVQKMFDWKYYKLSTGIDPDAIQIFLGTNGLKDDPADTVNAIARMVDNIRRHDPDIPIYLVNTLYWGDQEKIGTMVKQDGSAFLPGEFKNRSDKRVMDLAKAMAKKFKGKKNIVLIPLGFMHNSAANFEEGDALHPGAVGYDQFAAVMYSVYCGTLKEMLE